MIVTSQTEPVVIQPGGTIRFNVSDGIRRSADWRVWTSPNFDDVYAATRLTAGEIKISIHQTRSWSHGFTAGGKAAASLPPEELRHFTIWRRPAEICPGWTRAVRLIIPDDSLQVRPAPGAPQKPVTEFVTPDSGNATIAEIWLESATNHTPPPLAGSQLAGRLSQHGGGTVWVVGRRTALPWDPYQRFSQMIDSARSEALQLDPNWSGNPPLSICLHDPAAQKDDLMLCELAVTRLSRKPPFRTPSSPGSTLVTRRVRMPLAIRLERPAFQLPRRRPAAHRGPCWQWSRGCRDPGTRRRHLGG